jgi:L-seryl-tRNA(Ser) seleniumtransferase
MMHTTQSEIGQRAQAFVAGLESRELKAELIKGESLIGGGAAPSSTLPTTLIAIGSRSFGPNELAARLRHADPPVVARVEEGRILLDLRTVFPEQDEVFRQVLVRAAHS